jgi:hypothetical protein
MSEFELRRQLQALRRDAEPARDLWPSIAARIESAPAVAGAAPSRRWPWAAAASILMGLGVVYAISQLRDTNSTAAVAQGERAGTAWAVRQARAMEASYQGALRAGLGELSAEQWARLRAPEFAVADAELSAAAAELHQAIELDPSAPHLLKLLQRTHEQRARLWRASLAG